MIEYAKPSDIPALKQIWKVCFDDTDDFINAYFTHVFCPSEVLVLREEGNIVAMTTLHKAAAFCGEVSHDCLYVYAVATLPQHQGKGHFKRLMQAAEHQAKLQNKTALVTVPATESLIKLYQSVGYLPDMVTYQYTIKKEAVSQATQQVKIEACSKAIFLELRNQFLSSRPFFVNLSTDLMGYVYDYTNALGGQVLKAETNGQIAYIVCFLQGQELFIKESSLNYLAIQQIASHLMQKLGADTIRMNSPIQYAGDGKKIIYGMSRYIRPVKDKMNRGFVARLSGAEQATGYMNLMLD